MTRRSPSSTVMSGGNTRSVLDATTQQLLDAIRDQRGNDRIEWASEPELLVGGFSNKLWRLEITGDDELTGTLVGRVLPDADIALREIAVQTYLARAGFATPAVRLSGAPGQHLEHAWMLMEHVQATPLLADLSGLSALTRLPSLARSIPSRLARCATSLHSYDARPLAESLGTGNDVLDFLSHMRTRMVASKQTELVALANGLLAAPPDSDRIVVCHGDLHPFNVLASANGDTVIDWTTAQRADPTYDLAFTNGSAPDLVDISTARIGPRLKGWQSCPKRSLQSSVTRSCVSHADENNRSVRQRRTSGFPSRV
ncbi:MAG: aminoglycoside phosphotransferase family protein [Myxococcales bacterium]|nr:MAG: aminoglycoside phosphotransferase family protein [Myxococcales bacterium]